MLNRNNVTDLENKLVATHGERERRRDKVG